jgi:hypothetical protein
MVFDKHETVITALSLGLAGVLAMGACGWMGEHNARLKAEALTSGQQRDIESLKRDEEQAQEALHNQIAAIEKQRHVVMTPEKFVEEMKGLDLPKELQVQTLHSAASGIEIDAGAGSSAPDSQAEKAVVVPKEDLQAIWNEKLDCEERGAELTACSQKQSDLRKIVAVTETERDEWKTAAKGGSRWHRVTGAAKWFVLGAGVGLAVEGWRVSH